MDPLEEIERLRGLVREYAAVQREHTRQLQESKDGVEAEKVASLYEMALKEVERLQSNAAERPQLLEEEVRYLLAVLDAEWEHADEYQVPFIETLMEKMKGFLAPSTS